MKTILQSLPFLALVMSVTACDLSPNGLLGGQQRERAEAMSNRPTPDWSCYKPWIERTSHQAYSCPAMPELKDLILSIEKRWPGPYLHIKTVGLNDGSLKIQKLEYVPKDWYDSTALRETLECEAVPEPTMSSSHVAFDCKFDRHAPEREMIFAAMTLTNTNCFSSADYEARRCEKSDPWDTFDSNVFFGSQAFPRMTPEHKL